MRVERWLIAGLVVSLAANLALLGFIAGRFGAPEWPRLSADPMLGAMHVIRQLPEERRDALQPLLRPHLREMRATFPALRRAQHEIHEALTAEPFEVARLDAALGEFRTALLASQKAGHASLVELAAAMTPSERRQLLEAAARPHGMPRPPRPRPGDEAAP